jgi:DNA-binding transcriptional LysR family regulator
LGAALDGMGLAQVPEPIAADDVAAGRLVRKLEAFMPMTPGVFLYHPGRRQVLPKLRAFIDHVKSYQKDMPRSKAARSKNAACRQQ